MTRFRAGQTYIDSRQRQDVALLYSIQTKTSNYPASYWMSGTFNASKVVGRDDHSPSLSAEVELVQVYH